MIKKLILLMLCLCLMSSISMKVFADETNKEQSLEQESIISPYMDYIARASCFLYIDSNGKATTDCSVYGYQGITTKVTITANLQQYKDGRWVTIKTFAESANSHRAFLYETTTISKGYTYRVTAEVKAYSSSNVETRSMTSSEAVY
ncbi:hypothetical protein DW1_2791 [Proteiniborus sp. DW1]|uniref:hypothetical protein n=1 Tax=Proteiniborus sp. DW1 TaxID=1889883 RepID=UPI00092E0CA5|nr:hypothetical protein [Proteiniborus sp. DW1]SCG84351.1 hypothetical protein DW1_2791 [Proteiniborus sp. DW1]